MSNCFKYIVVISFGLLLFCCGNNNNETNKNELLNQKLSRNSSCIQYDDDKVIINIQDGLDGDSIFDAHEIIGPNYSISDPIKIQFNTDADIVKAQKITNYYPTIWAGLDNHTIQFVYLFDHCFKDTMDLEVYKKNVAYPLHGIFSKSKFQKFFSKISIGQIKKSIDQIPNEYEKKNTSLSYEYMSWRIEKNTFKKIANHYKKGEFVDANNEPFSVDPYEIQLIITFKEGDEIYTKTFCDEAIIGN